MLLGAVRNLLLSCLYTWLYKQFAVCKVVCKHGCKQWKELSSVDAQKQTLQNENSETLIMLLRHVIVECLEIIVYLWNSRILIFYLSHLFSSGHFLIF